MNDLESLQTELADVAREIAMVLTSSPIDRVRLDALDAAAAHLRGEIQRLMPPAVEVLPIGSRLVSGG